MTRKKLLSQWTPGGRNLSYRWVSIERGYADECSLGHQYMPQELVNPRSTLSNTVPDLKESANWYLKLPELSESLKAWVDIAAKATGSRRFVNSIIHEFLEPPVVHIVKKHEDMLRDIQATLPPHEEEQRQKSSITLCFKTLNERADANARLSAKGIQFRNGKTLVPFRLSETVPGVSPFHLMRDLMTSHSGFGLNHYGHPFLFHPRSSSARASQDH